MLVMIRGGGSVDDLAVFSTEQVTRAVASSRIPTVVAIGHEVDVSLSELAADLRFPDKSEVKDQLNLRKKHLKEQINSTLQTWQHNIEVVSEKLRHSVEIALKNKQQFIIHAQTLLESVHPKSTLKRGYALVESKNKLVSSAKTIKSKDDLKLTFKDGSVIAEAKEVK